MLKRIFTFLLVMSALIVNAQSIRVLYDGLPLSDNDTVFLPIDAGADQIDAFFGYENTTSTPLYFAVQKEELLLDGEGEFMFCIGDCYTGNVSAEVFLDAEESIDSEDDRALHVIYAGSVAPALVKYTFFLTNNNNDKTSVYVAYGNVSSVREPDLVRTIRAYPNPAVRSVTIDYVAPDNNSYLVVKNLTGREVYRTPVTSAGGKQIDVTSFNAGVYFYGIEADGKMVCTKKLLIK